MTFELPENFQIAQGNISYKLLDTGDVHVAFFIEDKDWEVASNGRIAGFIIPAQVDKRHLDQVLGEIRDRGGARFIVLPKDSS